MSRQSIFFAILFLFFCIGTPGVQSQHAINTLTYDYALMFYGNGPATTTGGTLLGAQTTIENCWNAILAKSPAAPYVISGYKDYMFALQAGATCYYTTNGATQYTTTFLGGLGNAAEWAPLQPPGASTSIWYHVSNLTQYAVDQAVVAPLPILGTSTFYSYQCIFCTAVNSSGLQDVFYETSTVNAANYLVQVLLGKLTQTYGMFAFGAFGNTFTGYSPTSGTQSAILFPVNACPPTAISVVPCVGGVNTHLSTFPASSPYTVQSIALYQPLCTQPFSIWSPNTTQACVFDPCTYYLQLNNATACANGGTCANNYTANASPVFSCTCTGNFNPATNCTSCTTGWTGSGCNVWNPCSLINPCQNGATCVNNATSGGFPQSSCTCTTGWTGGTCGVWNPCLFNNTCLNGGTCVGNATQGGSPSLTCNCAQGYVGTTCQTWNPCAFNNTCLNGGTCVNNATQNGIPQQTCTCAPGYTGATCQTWNPCGFNNTCLNGGTCVNNDTQNGIPQQTCTCAPGYTGATCQTWNPCGFNNTCLNGGTCVNNATQNGIPQQTCTCAQGYVGTTCQTWNPCAFNNTCLNGGTCINNATQNGIPQQTCTCAQGYVGTTCQTWNPCGFNNTCLNGGTCINNATQNGIPQQTCTCAQGYIGTTCQTWNPCAFNNTCLNGGTCMNNATQNGTPQQTCTCAQGYVGTTCQTWNPCGFNNTCLNGGTCVNNATQNGIPQQTCTCAQGYVGTTCQTWNPCAFNNTCLNGGTCINNATQNGIPQQTCTCARGYIGTTCQTWNPCGFNNTCLNGGTCINNATQNGIPQQTCACAQGYVGTTCQTWNPCGFNNTCLNGGTCTNNATQNGTPQQTCTCAQGYVGTTCQTWNPCAFNSSYCQNGGTCNNNITQNGIPQQTCTCAPGYRGTNCQTWDPCTYYNQPCQNFGLCTNNITAGGNPLFQCTCSLGYTGQNCSVWDPCNAIPNVCPRTAIGCVDSSGPSPGQPNVTCQYSSTTLANQGYRYAVMSDVIGPSSSRGSVLIGNAANIIQCVNMILSTPGLPFLTNFQDAFFYFSIYSNPAQCYYLNSTTQLNSFQASVQSPASWQQLLNLQSESWFHIANLTAYSLVSSTLPYFQMDPRFDPVECLTCPAAKATLQALYLASSLNAANYLIQTLGGFPDMAYSFFSSGSIPNSFFEFFPNSPNQTVMVHDQDDCPGGLSVVSCGAQSTSPVASSFGIPTYNALLYRPTCDEPFEIWDPLANGPSNTYTYCEFEPCKYQLQHGLTSCFNNGSCTDNHYAQTTFGGGTLPAFNCSCIANFTAISNCTACAPGFVGSDCHWDPCTYYHPCSASGTCVNSAFPLAQGSQPYLCRCTLGYVGVNCSTWDPCDSYVNPCPSGGVCTNRPSPDPSLNYTCAYDPNQLVINSFPYGVSITEFALENYITSGFTYLGPTSSAAECINIVLARAAQLPFVIGYQDIFFHFQQYSNPPDCAYISSQTVYNELQSTVSTPGAWTSMFGQGAQTIWYHIANLTAYSQTNTFLPGIECLFCSAMAMNNELVYYADTLQAANSYVQLLAQVPKTAISFYTLTAVPLKFGPNSPNATLGAFTVSDCPGGLQVVSCANQPLTFFSATLTSYAFYLPLYRPACNSSAYQVWLPEQNGGNGNGCVYDPCTYFAQHSITTCLQGGTCMDVPISSANPQGFTCSCPTGYNPATNCSTCAPGFTGSNCQWQPCSYYAGACQNGGTCVANATAGGVQPYTCSCPSGFTGVNCQTWNPCATSACTMGSVCTANATVGGSPSYSCACLYGFGGGNCSTWNPCVFTSGACAGHGICTKNATVMAFPGYTCNCSVGYAGSNCTQCDVGYVGSNCHWDSCTYLGGSVALCGANGICQGSAGPPLNYTCGCIPGYIGNGCQTWDPCV